ncbi:MAG: LysR family transcriptional regulator [Hyphomicrobiaceae bacterium]|nr:LysR family transcriptional regulator [Hyphomicrobiaceae bacterium]
MASIRSSNVTLTRLRAFAGVVESGSFTAAADLLGMTQSGVSQAISGLEQALGAPLVRRDPGGVTATEIGEKTLNDALAALRSVERMQQRCSDYKGLQSGTIVIGSVGSAAARLLPQVLKELCARHPALNVSVIEGTDPEVADWVERGVVDFGLTADDRETLKQTVVVEDEFVAVFQSNHPLTSNERVSLRELKDVPFVMPGASCEAPIRKMFEDVGTEPTVVCKVRGTASLLDMVRVGIGTTLVPELCLPAEATQYATVKLDPPVVRRLLAVQHPNVESTPGVEAILALLMDLDRIGY